MWCFFVSSVHFNHAEIIILYDIKFLFIKYSNTVRLFLCNLQLQINTLWTSINILFLSWTKKLFKQIICNLCYCYHKKTIQLLCTVYMLYTFYYDLAVFWKQMWMCMNIKLMYSRAHCLLWQLLVVHYAHFAVIIVEP